MNIKQAKQEIKNAMQAYLTKDEFGEYVIPIEKQRPVFLMGPPGIGKTAIMEQIASELGVGLVSYSMTHHTRQSALGLPFIVKKNYGGKECSVSEYTMSEIITSVYDMMEETGLIEGILFLDEINCVSETLAPAMLEFLQYKVFGRHRVPDGWIVVTAGNPPEYNNSVREYDIVTWDRLKRIDVEPDYDVWKEYAYKKGIHPSIVSYLDIKKQNFYKIETTVDGKTFVTARGWSDLSDMMKLYEKNGIAVNEDLIKQYLQNPKIAKDFAMYYDLFNKYRSDYQVDQILEGTASDEIQQRAKAAKFDERLSLLSLLMDAISNDARQVYYSEQTQLEVMKYLTDLNNLNRSMKQKESDVSSLFNKYIQRINYQIEAGKKSASLSDDKRYIYHSSIRALSDIEEKIVKENPGNSSDVTKIIKREYNKGNKDLRALAAKCGEKMTNALKFCEEVFGEGQEILILVTELTSDYYTVDYISHFGCDEYFKHNKELLFYDRQKEIMNQLEKIDLK